MSTSRKVKYKTCNMITQKKPMQAKNTRSRTYLPQEK